MWRAGGREPTDTTHVFDYPPTPHRGQGSDSCATLHAATKILHPPMGFRRHWHWNRHSRWNAVPHPGVLAARSILQLFFLAWLALAAIYLLIQYPALIALTLGSLALYILILIVASQDL